MKKLRVALCITELEWGGAEQCLMRLATGLDRDRFEPSVYCLAPRPRAEISCLAPLENAGIPTYCLGGRKKWLLPLVTSRLTQLFKKNRPHLIQSFLVHANIVAAWAAHRAGIRPVIAGIRVAERRRTLPFSTYRYVDRWIDRYVCVSCSVADFFHDKSGTNIDKLVVVPNGIDMTSYPADNGHIMPAADIPVLDELGVDPDRRLICFVGRLDKQKGVDWMLDGARSWLEQLPDHDLLVVGAGPLRSQLEEIARRNDIANRVHFAGWQTDVAAILARCELLLLPSLWEGMPNVVMEAMASARPVVVTRVEGVEELLGPLSDPQMVDCGDTTAFAKKIIALASNSQFSRDIGRQNRARIVQHFSLAKMIDSYEQLWESLVTHRSV